ncbi:hypothetical protein HKX48_002985, partial [Thoreauomyces humboldtii]
MPTTILVYGLSSVATLRVHDATDEQPMTISDLRAHIKTFLATLLASAKADAPSIVYDFELAAGERELDVGTDASRPVSYFRVFSTSFVLRVQTRRRGDVFSVAVKTLYGRQMTCDVDTLMTVKQLKHAIRWEEGMSEDIQRIIHGGKQLEDWCSLSDYCITDQAVLQLVLRLRGGGGPGVEFVDVGNKAGPERIGWAKTAPAWCVVEKGMILRGKCTNSSCKAYKHTVYINLGLGEYNPAFDFHHSVCPTCHDVVDAKDCGFSKCDYRYFGIRRRKTSDQAPPTPELSAWKTVTDADAFQLFRSTRLGTVVWSQLLFQTRRSTDEKSTTARCMICRMDVNEE